MSCHSALCSQALNELAAGLPITFVSGRIAQVTATIPWMCVWPALENRRQPLCFLVPGIW